MSPPFLLGPGVGGGGPGGVGGGIIHSSEAWHIVLPPGEPTYCLHKLYLSFWISFTYNSSHSLSTYEYLLQLSTNVLLSWLHIVGWGGAVGVWSNDDDILSVGLI